MSMARGICKVRLRALQVLDDGNNMHSVDTLVKNA